MPQLTFSGPSCLSFFQELQPGGWLPWGNDTFQGRPYLGEYGSKGPGAKRQQLGWVNPGARMTLTAARSFRPEPFLNLSSWLPRK